MSELFDKLSGKDKLDIPATTPTWVPPGVFSTTNTPTEKVKSVEEIEAELDAEKVEPTPPDNPVLHEMGQELERIRNSRHPEDIPMNDKYWDAVERLRQYYRQIESNK